MSPDGDGRVSEVLARLGRVCDPELDEPVTELGFVTGVTVSFAGQVAVGFRLPTYWCAANFAFLMADDMRSEVLTLPWVTGVTVELGEHMYADTINRAMRTGQSFQDAFADEADGDLREVRRIFALKAFQRRQLVLLEHLCGLGFEPSALLSLTIGELQRVDTTAQTSALVERYLQRRDLPGPAGPRDPAFVDTAGHTIAPERFAAHRRVLRGVAVTVEFNGALCRGLLASRFGEVDQVQEGEPTLLDFIRGRQPEPHATRG